MQKRLQNIITIFVVLGMMAVPLSYNLVRHHCQISNAEYLSLSGINLSCHAQPEKKQDMKSADCSTIKSSSESSKTCYRKISLENYVMPSFSEFCCTNQLIPLFIQGVYKDYKVNLKFENPEIQLLERFILISDLSHIELPEFELPESPPDIFPPNELIYRLGQLLI